MGRKAMRRNHQGRNCVTIGIILLFIGASFIPSMSGTTDDGKNEFLQLNESRRADVIITDSLEDVYSVNYTTQEKCVVTSHPDIEVDNLDIMEATYTQQGIQVTISVQVVGIIENRGKIIDIYNHDFSDLNFVEYDFQITTSEQDYTISYANHTGQISHGIETMNLTSSDYSVVGDTLSIWFSLTSAEEVYESLSTICHVRENEFDR